MIRSLSLSLLFSIISFMALGQTFTVSGTLKDKAKNTPVNAATVHILQQNDSTIVRSQISEASGAFSFSLPPGRYILDVEAMSFQQYVDFFRLDSADKIYGEIGLTPQGKDLSAVIVVARPAPVVNKDDTAQFAASQYKVNPDATTEDLIKKMPGIQVGRDGSVTAQGETVRKVTIDGKDFFGDDASAALKNLPAEVVDKIQVFDRLSDQAQQTGVDDGNSVKAINVVTKAGLKNGQFGRVYAGIGTDERYQAGGNMSFFEGDRRISLVGNFNNINQQNFGSQDLLGITSGGGGRRGGGRGGMGGGAGNFMVGQSNGISRTNAFGVNYSDKWGTKTSVSGSYFFNNSRTENNSDIFTQTFRAANRDLFSDELTNTVTFNTNHRINMRLEHQFDSTQSLTFIPSVSFQKNRSSGFSDIDNYYSATDSLNTSLSDTYRNSNGYNIRTNLMYRKSFGKKGRTAVVGFTTNFNKNDNNNILDAHYRFFENGFFTDSLPNQQSLSNSNGRTLGLNLSYSEPIAKNTILQFEYNPSVQKNKADQETNHFNNGKYSVFDTALSNKFDNTVTTQNGGISLRYNPDRNNILSISVNAQNSRLESDRIYPTVSRVDQSFFNILPRAFWRKKVGQYGNLRMFYRASTDFPSVTQLQDVVNITNPLRISMGNPELKQAVSNSIMGRYNWANTRTSKSFFIMFFGQATNDYISNAIYLANADSTLQNGMVLKEGSQLVKPVNLNGYRSLRSMANYNMPVAFLKSNLSLTAGINYSLLPGITNNLELETKNVTYNTGLNLASNISEYIDFNLGYNVNFSNAKTATNLSTTNTNYVNQVGSFAVNLLSKKGWFLQNDVSSNLYTGLSEGFNTNFWLWNASVGKKFLKNNAAELKLSVFDLLKQNQSVIRTVTANYIEDAQYNVLQQYFMLTFTYNLKNFGTGKPEAEEDRGPRPPMPGGAPHGRPMF